MKRSFLLFAGIAVLSAAALVARADDAAKGTRLPFNPWTGLKEGDWATFTFHMGEAAPQNMMFRVEKVTADKIRLAESQVGSPGGRVQQFDLNQPPTVDDYLETGGEPTSAVKVADEDKKLGDKTFHCKKLTFPHTVGTAQEAWTVWICPDVKGGLVAFENQQTQDGKTGTISVELLGYGSGETAVWGKTPKDLMPGPTAGTTDTPMPVNPFADAKPGDWCAVVSHLQMPDGLKTSVLGWKVDKVEGDKVAVTVMDDADTRPDVFSAKDAPTFQKFLDMQGATLAVTKTEDAQVKVGDRTFSGKKVTVEGSSPEIGKVTLEAVFSPDVKVSGIASLSVTFRVDANTSMTATAEVAGFGSADGTKWGKTFDEARASLTQGPK